MRKKALAILIMSISICVTGCGNETTLGKQGASDKGGIEQAQPQASDESNKEITIDEAKTIALDNAKLTSDKVSFIRAESDFDNGVRKYDIEFYYDNNEYDYEISATDGKIISSNIEYNNSQENQQSKQPQETQNSEAEISLDEAKQIALKDAKLTSDKVSFIRSELEVDDGVKKYEIDFTYNNREYDYEIDADSGSILSYDRE